MEGFIILDWVSVCSLIISVVSGGIGFVSGIINRKFNEKKKKNMIELKDKLEQKMEDDRKEFERDRDKLKREFEKDLLSIKTNFEKEIYTYKARYDHKVEMMKEMLEFVDIVDTAVCKMCCVLNGGLRNFLEKHFKYGVEIQKCETLYNKYRPFVKKEVIENFRCFFQKVIEFTESVYVFWYDNKFLTEKDKRPRYKYYNIDCKNIGIQYEKARDLLRKRDSLIKFRDVDEILYRYDVLREQLMYDLSEQVREYLNEK